MSDFLPVSIRCVDWVLDDAPVAAHLAPVLLVIAARCNDDGRGSAQTLSDIAKKCGKSETQTQRDIARLRNLGLLLAGDPSVVDHLPVGQRPAVYDIPLNLRGLKPTRAPRNPVQRTAPAGARRRPIPTGVRLAVLFRDGEACVKCGSTEDITLDHIHPWALGGPDTEDNLRVFCRSCNSRKGMRIEVGE